MQFSIISGQTVHVVDCYSMMPRRLPIADLDIGSPNSILLVSIIIIYLFIYSFCSFFVM